MAGALGCWGSPFWGHRSVLMTRLLNHRASEGFGLVGGHAGRRGQWGRPAFALHRLR